MYVNYMNNSFRKFHAAMTTSVIALHQKGYEADFFQLNDQFFTCSQNNKTFRKTDLAIHLTGKFSTGSIDQYLYLQSIVSEDGTMGLLISNNLLA